jgi:glutamate formiminotransferase
MSPIECVPNISEGRRPDVIAACADAVRRSGVTLLNVSSDPSHNRTVFTFAGDAEAILDAVLDLFAEAIRHIDLRRHAGVHPRVGAVDVTPFVPLGTTPMTACVNLARRAAAEVARRFEIPVYLYEEAATAAERRNLADIRRGQLEGLAARMTEMAWRPDFGPAAPHPSAGVAVIGARRALIAYNVNLATDRLDVAVRIAAAIRERGGGLRGVRALGLALPDRGHVQVTINVTDVRATSLHEIFTRVVEEAHRDGVAVIDSEIVGLVPAAALTATAARALRLADFSDSQVVEYLLRKDEGWLL